MRQLDELFQALARSRFRQRIRLNHDDVSYLQRKSLAVVMDHARQFIRERLVPAEPPNDGRQTPMRGHPVFPAQHATATCCRGCLAKWHGIPKGRELTEQECDYVLRVIQRWLEAQQEKSSKPPGGENRQRLLF